jgi:hypothetical protein
LVEQQSAPRVQASPRVLHAVVPEGEGSAWHVTLQLPVQHSLPDPHVVPVALHTVFAHWPLTHESEQHSLESAQAPPGPLQKAVVVQVPALAACVGFLQAVEQHSSPVVQLEVDALQVETAGAQSCVRGSQ